MIRKAALLLLFCFILLGEGKPTLMKQSLAQAVTDVTDIELQRLETERTMEGDLNFTECLKSARIRVYKNNNGKLEGSVNFTVRNDHCCIHEQGNSQTPCHQVGPAVCPPIKPPGNGSARVSKNENEVIYSCNSGFYLSGAKQRVCTKGTWSPTKPKCAPCEYTDINFLNNDLNALYKTTISLSASLLDGTICQAERDVFSRNTQCGTIKAQNDSTIIFDVKPASSPEPASLTLKVENSSVNPLQKISAVYTGVNLDGIGRYQITKVYNAKGETIQEIRKFQPPGASEFLNFPPMTKVIQPGSAAECNKYFPSPLGENVPLPQGTEDQFRNSIGVIYRTHCTCL